MRKALMTNPPLLNLLIASHSGCQFLQVSVVDNDSQDGSVKTLQTAIETEDWGDWVTLIPSDRNGGMPTEIIWQFDLR
jgi:GT2 family glycosyltransferase